jgi:GTP pyrophosphokinase
MSGKKRYPKTVAMRCEDEKCLPILLAGVQRLLEKNGIQARIEGRMKSLQGIRRKMARTGKALDQIMDRVGLRIIVTSVPECYRVLGLLHAHFKPVSGTFDDYIGHPKKNGYQSLHTCVYPVREISHKPIEFQVRTELMHREAEHGTAAHWRYKNEMESPKKAIADGQWVQGPLTPEPPARCAEPFVDLLHRHVFDDHLVVFGNGGRIQRLPEKATVRDYLAKLDMPPPDSPVVKVNGEVAELDRCLRDGDSIDIVKGETASRVISAKVPRHPNRKHPLPPDHQVFVGQTALFGGHSRKQEGLILSCP